MSANLPKQAWVQLCLPKEEIYLLTYSIASLYALCSISMVFNWAVPCSKSSCKLLIWWHALVLPCTMRSKFTQISIPDTRKHNTITINLPLLHLLPFTPNTDAHRHTHFKMKKHEASMTSADSNSSKCLFCSYTNTQTLSFCKINFIKTKTTHYVDLWLTTSTD